LYLVKLPANRCVSLFALRSHPPYGKLSFVSDLDHTRSN
jgi:hypothetical protein